jgi:toxin ParE1/3/4
VTKPARFSARARAEIREAGAWIAKDNRSAARAFRDAVSALAQLIGEHPDVGFQRLDVARAPYRFFVVRGFPHLVVYDPSSDPPTIARVVHGARDLPEVLKDL